MTSVSGKQIGRKNNATELKEKIEDSHDWWDCLMEHGFDPHDSETYICGVINIEKLDKHPWDTNPEPKEDSLKA